MYLLCMSYHITFYQANKKLNGHTRKQADTQQQEAHSPMHGKARSYLKDWVKKKAALQTGLTCSALFKILQ